jgi:hypothetical protein
MFDHIFQWENHVSSSFPTVTPPVRGLGLDDASTGPLGSAHLGPVEYVFKLGVSPAIKNAEGILFPTGTRSPTFISFVGSRGETGMIPIKSGFKAGAIGEYSTLSKDVGPIKAIKLAEPFSRSSSWRPTTVEVNRLAPSDGNNGGNRGDGWVKFDVNKVIKEPVVIAAKGSTGVPEPDKMPKEL